MFRRRAYSLLLLLSLASHAQTAQKKVQQPVTVEVKDESGAVVPAAVDFISQKGCFKSAKAGPDGHVSVELPQDQYELLVYYSGFRLKRRSVYVGDQPQAIAVELKVGGCDACIEYTARTVTILVVDEKGKALQGARVWLQSPHGDGSYAYTSGDGRLKIGLPAPASYQLVIAKDGFVPHTGQVLVDPAEEMTLRVTLKKGEGCLGAANRDSTPPGRNQRM